MKTFLNYFLTLTFLLYFTSCFKHFEFTCNDCLVKLMITLNEKKNENKTKHPFKQVLRYCLSKYLDIDI